MKNQLVIGLASLFILVFTSSCHYDEVLPQVVELPDEPQSYATDIQPFFEAKCNACHGGSIPPNLSASVSYSELISGNYIDTSNPASSPLYTSIDIGGSMETYATPSERAMVLAWIEQGAPDN
ncbi:MAG: hypothetical protein ABJG78_10775 [Cyclobacteriaceae bacterium]